MKPVLKESAVVILFLKGTSKVLFLMRKEGWCLPGGKQDPPEDIITCARRELDEETGILIKAHELVYLGSELSVSGRIVHVFSSNTEESLPKISSEHSEWKWVEWDKIKDLTLSGNTGKFLGLLKPY